MKKSSLLLIVPITALVLAGCSGGGNTPAETPAEPAAETSEAVGEALPFATTPDATQTNLISETQLNYQTGYTIAEVAEFYRGQHEELTEREIVTVEDETTLNLVLDGDPNGALVVQGVKLDDTTTNVNVRYEDI